MFDRVRMENVCFPLNCKEDKSILLAAESETAAAACAIRDFQALVVSAEIATTKTTNVSCSIRIVDKIVLPWVKLFRRHDHALCVNPDTQSYEVQIRARQLKDGILPLESRISCWQLALLGGILKEMLRGQPICLIHGALLSSSKGNILLTGQSGIGKSTTSRRWREAGGLSWADDMNLLEFCDDGIWAHPLPTWSRCKMDGIEGVQYPFNPPVHVNNLMILGRDPEHEHIKEVSNWEYFQSVYSAVCLFYMTILQHIPEIIRLKALSIFQKNAGVLCKSFNHKALLAHLDGDIRNTLKEYL